MTPTNLKLYPPKICSSTRKKTSGKEARRTPDVKLRIVGFIRFVSILVIYKK